MAAFVRWVDRLSIACAAVAAILLALAAIVITWSVIYRAHWSVDLLGDRVLRLHDGRVVVPRVALPLATNGHVGVDLAVALPCAASRTPARDGGGADRTRGVPLSGDLPAAITRSNRFPRANAPRVHGRRYKWPLFLTLPLGLGLTALQYIADLVRRPAPASTRGDA